MIFVGLASSMLDFRFIILYLEFEHMHLYVLRFILLFAFIL